MEASQTNIRHLNPFGEKPFAYHFSHTYFPQVKQMLLKQGLNKTQSINFLDLTFWKEKIERTCTTFIYFFKQLCIQQHSVLHLANFYFPILQASSHLNCQKKLFTPMDDSETKAVLCPPGLLVSSKWVPSTGQKQQFAGRSVNTAGETGLLLILEKKNKRYKHFWYYA